MIELLIFIVICCWVVISAVRWWVRTRPRVGWSPPARSAGTLRLRWVVRVIFYLTTVVFFVLPLGDTIRELATSWLGSALVFVVFVGFLLGAAVTLGDVVEWIWRWATRPPKIGA